MIRFRMPRMPQNLPDLPVLAGLRDWQATIDKDRLGDGFGASDANLRKLAKSL